MATNYSRGYQTEHRLKVLHAEAGYFWITRSPASKGRFDLTCVGQKGAKLIQAKRTKRKPVPSLYKDEMEELEKWCELAFVSPLPNFVSVEWHCWEDKQGWHVWVYDKQKKAFVKVLERAKKKEYETWLYNQKF